MKAEKREVEMQIMGCALVGASILFVLVFGLAILGSFFPKFSFFGLAFSVASLIASATIFLGATVYHQVQRAKRKSYEDDE